MIPADAEETVVTVDEIATRYAVATTQVANWTKMPGFPEGWAVGQTTLTVRDAGEVDDWLRNNFPVHWAKGQDSDNPHNLPDGGERDLLSLDDIAKLEQQVLGRDKPVPVGTLRAYISKGTMPGPDRIPGDRKKPEVTDRRWFRATAYTWLNRPRKAMKRTQVETPATPPPLPVPAATADTSQGARLTVPEIATKYDVNSRTVEAWSQSEGFPERRDDSFDATAVGDWVRTHRRQAWNRVQRRPATGSAPAASGPNAPAKGSGATTPSAGAGGRDRSRGKSPVEVDAKAIAQRFGVPHPTAVSWTVAKDKPEGRTAARRGFPPPLRQRPRVWDQEKVDAWVEECRPHVWAAFTDAGPALRNPLPEGNPRDLLDVNDFAEIWGNATRGKPLARETVVAHHNRGEIPFADRSEGDGKTPRVFAYHWYRKTVYEHILSRTGEGNFGPREPREPM